MSKPYQWSVGETCVRVEAPHGWIDMERLKPGAISYVTEVCRDMLPDRIFDGQPIRVYGNCYTSERGEWSDGVVYRPLHGTDIRKLEEKYPEYIIKTNEVEG